MNQKLKPIPELDDLPCDRRELLHEWIEKLGYRQALAKLKEEWDIDVTYNKLYRYYRRVLQKAPFDDLLEDRITMPDFLALLNGDHVPYDEAGIGLILKRAFDLACAREITPSDLGHLLRVMHYKKNCQWNERRLSQNDHRIQISARLARLRESAASQKLAAAGAHGEKEDALGPFARNLDGVEERAARRFGISQSAKADAPPGDSQREALPPEDLGRRRGDESQACLSTDESDSPSRAAENQSLLTSSPTVGTASSPLNSALSAPFALKTI